MLMPRLTRARLAGGLLTLARGRPLALAAVVAAVAIFGSVPAHADDGSSTVVTPTGEPANLRPCPGPPAYGAHDCAVIGHLDSGTRVRMICWENGGAPSDGPSRKWFYVTVADGPMAGRQGYVWSDFIPDQTVVPVCGEVSFPLDGSQTTQAQVSLQLGPVAPHGYRYDIQLVNFAPDSDVEVRCFDEADPDGDGFYAFSLHTDSAGSASTASQCYSDQGPSHWVTAGGVQSNTAIW